MVTHNSKSNFPLVGTTLFRVSLISEAGVVTLKYVSTYLDLDIALVTQLDYFDAGRVLFQINLK